MERFHSAGVGHVSSSVSAGEIANVRLAVSQRRMVVLVACVVATLRVGSRVQGISTFYFRRRTYTAVEKW